MSSGRRAANAVDIRRLRNRILTYTTAGVLVTVLLTAGLVLLPIYANLRRAQQARLIETASVRASAIEQTLWRARSVALQVTSRTRARHLLQQYTDQKLELSDYTAQASVILADALRLSDEVAGITRLDPARSAPVSVGKPVPPEYWPAQRMVQRIQLRGVIELDGKLYSLVAAPIRDSADMLVGVDLLLFNFTAVEQILRSEQGLEKVGKVALLRTHDGGADILLVGPQASAAEREMANAWFETILQNGIPPASRGILEVPGSERRLVAFSRVSSGADWVVVVAMGTGQLYSRLNRQLALVVASVLVLALAGAGGMYLVLRPLAGGMLIHVDSLEQQVEAATAALQSELLERKEAERIATHAATALQESNRELEQFAYIASHDLQEPLRTVASFAQLLERRYKGKLDKSADEFIEFIVDGARRGQNLIADLLAYSRVGTRPGIQAVVRPEKVLREVMDGLTVVVDENNATVHWDDMPPVIADPTQLAQLFQNLISNAIRFRSPDRQPEIAISAKRDNGFVEFSVADNGVGIDPDHQDRIFEIFQRLHGPELPGTGMGLAIAKKIVERHGGTIRVESAPGMGSTFKFTLHAADDDHGTANTG